MTGDLPRGHEELARLAGELSHPHRVRILVALAGHIELSRTGQGRGAVEHYYRLAGDPSTGCAGPWTRSAKPADEHGTVGPGGSASGGHPAWGPSRCSSLRMLEMAAYEAQIATQDQIEAEFRVAADEFEPLAREVLEGEDLTNTLEAIRGSELCATYFRHLSFVQRFVIAEMDTEAPSKRGIGRLADGDPPPRLGAKYRKKLRNEEARRSIGLAAERLVLSGFAAQAAFFEGTLEAKGDEEAWEMWLRHLISYYNDTNDLMGRVRSEEHSNLGIIGAMIVMLGNHGGSELIEGFEAHHIIRGFPRRNSWHNARALSYLSLLLGAGRALHHVLSEEADPSFGSLQSVRLLEDYSEKRNKRQMVTQIKAE